MLRCKTDRMWFSRLFDIRPGNGSGSILTTPEPYTGPLLQKQATSDTLYVMIVQVIVQ